MINLNTKKGNIRKPHLALAFSAIIVPFAIMAEDLADFIKEAYKFNRWAGTTKTNYQKAVSDFQPKLSEIGLSSVRFKDSEIVPNGMNRRYIVSPPAQTNEVVDIRISCRNSIAAAQNSMMDFFSMCSAIQPFPSGDALSISVGDRCYLGYPTNTVTSIAFVRNTVFVDVTSRGTTNSVLPIATWLDNLIMGLSQ